MRCSHQSLGWTRLAVAMEVLITAACVDRGAASDAADGTAADAVESAVPDVTRCEPDVVPASDARDALTDAGTPDAGRLCCTTETCAPLGQACDPATCRCRLVPCERAGEACDPAQLPGVAGDIVCAASEHGSFCYVRVDRPEACPALAQWCGPSGSSCLCGFGCRFFVDRCSSGQVCRPATLSPDLAAMTICRGGPGPGVVGSPCDSSYECRDGLVCSSVRPYDLTSCLRPNCGLAEGAPDCPAGTVCAPLDASQLLGVCVVPCALDDPNGPCNAMEICASLQRGPGVGPSGTCVRVSQTPLPVVGERCEGYCRVGSVCASLRCMRVCDPAATGACPAGQACACLGTGAVCAEVCDPRAALHARVCPTDFYCAAHLDACGALTGDCMPSNQELPGPGAACWDLCDAGRVCSTGQVRRCRAPCAPGATSGPDACPAGERCFSRADAVDTAALPAGFCAPPCTPGSGDCAWPAWCAPLALDPASGAWNGACL